MPRVYSFKSKKKNDFRPHIIFRNGKWWCYGRTSCYRFPRQGQGNTPHEAYLNWELLEEAPSR